MSMGHRIFHRRTELGLTQAELAHRSGLGSQTIWRMEHDEGEHKASSVEAIATILGVTTDFLIRGDASARKTRGAA